MNKVAFVVGLVAFSIGISLTLLVVTNPFQWMWLQSLQHVLVGGPHEMVTEDGELWACGMHPEVVREEPGTCPICNMELVPVRGTSSTEAGGERKVKYWQTPMDPTYISDEPGKSPMGMDLIPVYEDESPSEDGSIRIDPAFVQNMGVQSELIERRDLSFTVRTVGTLTYDDRQLAGVTTKYEGWIEAVYVNYVGEPVTEGQKLFEVYSPELVTTQKEYLQARAYAERMEESKYPEVAARASALVASARERLRSWDVSEQQIAELEAGGAPRRTLAVVAPITGVVVEKMGPALEGMFVRPGMNLYRLVDLSTIWLEAEVFESQAPWIGVGSRARIEFPYGPTTAVTGRVRYLNPSFSERTRTMTVGVELPNPDGKLRPDMYADVSFDVPAARDVVAVPETSVLRSGVRDVLVVERGEGRFAVREVRLGARGGGYIAVEEGVDAGERVVVSAQFLIDSESNLQEALQKLTSGSDAPEPMDHAEPASDAAPAHQHH